MCARREGLLDALSERDECFWPLRPYRYPGLDMVFIGARVRLLAVSYNCTVRVLAAAVLIGVHVPVHRTCQPLLGPLE